MSSYFTEVIYIKEFNFEWFLLKNFVILIGYSEWLTCSNRSSGPLWARLIWDPEMNINTVMSPIQFCAPWIILQIHPQSVPRSI